MLRTRAGTWCQRRRPPIQAGGNPRYIAITPNGRTAYVVTEGTGISPGSVTPIKLAWRTVRKPARINVLPEGIVITH
jgi:6-phosphogluconolactonase (cycloisomerase 2 family)